VARPRTNLFMPDQGIRFTSRLNEVTVSRTQLQNRTLTAPFMSNIEREMDQLQSSIRRMFENPFAVAPETLPLSRAATMFPPMDITESDATITMTVELPGLDRKDVRVELDGDVLTVSGEKRDTRVEDGKEKQYHLEERSYGAFQRSFTLPPTVDGNLITADFDKGVLTLQLPRSKQAKPRGRDIPIGGK
jgi:HSP20 family protein